METAGCILCQHERRLDVIRVGGCGIMELGKVTVTAGSFKGIVDSGSFLDAWLELTGAVSRTLWGASIGGDAGRSLLS